MKMSVDENKKPWKRSFSYSNKGQSFEEELTFDKFLSGIQNGLEYFFTYFDHSIDIAYHFNGLERVYEVNLDGYTDNPVYFTFHSADELVHHAILEGKTIQELWDELET